MVLKTCYKKYENQIIAAVLILVLGLMAAIRYDFYFDLNDDVVMKDILAGVYTGVPESRNIQMLYPISLIISLLYRIFPYAPVYGIFLCFFQFFSMYLIAERSLSFRSNTPSKLLIACMEGFIVLAMVFEHLIFVQYTFTSGLLAGTAAFLFITTENGLPAKKFLQKNVLTLVLVFLAFLIRSEMLLLLLPLICVAGVYKWSKEQEIFSKDNLRKYLTIIGGIAIGLVIGYAFNEAAYSSEKWNTFMEYFDSRTELYDFQGIPSYENNERFYRKLGYTESEQEMLFEQYNFGLDETVDAGTLSGIAQYQAQLRSEKETVKDNLVRSIKDYWYRCFQREAREDYPFNVFVILTYLSVFISGIWNDICSGAGKAENKESAILWRNLWKLLFLGAVRTVLWMFLLMRGRTPERITHSLYFMELSVLWGMLHVECEGIEAKIYGKIKATVVFRIIFLVTAAASLCLVLPAADKEYQAREEANVTDWEMKEYCRSHKDNFYFIDVYSSVSDPVTSIPYSEKLFTWNSNTVSNYDIMGGWLVKSPLYQKKLDAFQISTMREGLAYDEKVYFMAELEKGTDYLIDYYMDQDITVEAKLVDTINGIVGVYQIRAAAR